MDAYPYCRVGPNGSLITNGLHHPGFPTLLWNMLQHFDYVEKPAYHGCIFREFQIGRSEVHVDMMLNTKQPSVGIREGYTSTTSTVSPKNTCE
jgi:hypothetical protein